MQSSEQQEVPSVIQNIFQDMHGIQERLETVEKAVVSRDTQILNVILQLFDAVNNGTNQMFERVHEVAQLREMLHRSTTENEHLRNLLVAQSKSETEPVVTEKKKKEAK